MMCAPGSSRPLDDVYPVIFLDALVLKIREGGTVQRRVCYLALGVAMDGERDVMGMWFQRSEGRDVLVTFPAERILIFTRPSSEERYDEGIDAEALQHHVGLPVQ